MSSKTIDKNPAQLSLLDLLMKQKEERLLEPCEGSHNIQVRLRQALVYAIEYARPASRYEIAGRMSHLLGRQISKEMIDTWTAESKQAHRIPAEYIPAFCAACGCDKPLQVMNDATGIYTVQGPDALRAEKQKKLEGIKKEQKQVREIDVLINVLEAKR